MARKSKQLPPQSYLKQIFEYCPKTGQLFWCVSRKGVSVGRAIKSMTNEGYCRVRVDGTVYYLHRIIWKLVHGTEPKQIDHINGDRSDNRIENLRSISHSHNAKNQKKHKRNTSGVTGVYKTKYGTWCARITVNGQHYGLGTYDNMAAAVNARQAAERQHNFHVNHGT